MGSAEYDLQSPFVEKKKELSQQEISDLADLAFSIVEESFKSNRPFPHRNQFITNLAHDMDVSVRSALDAVKLMEGNYAPQLREYNYRINGERI